MPRCLKQKNEILGDSLIYRYLPSVSRQTRLNLLPPLGGYLFNAHITTVEMCALNTHNLK
jgi:hypothetical protein